MYLFDLISYAWLCLALVSYSIINILQTNISGYAYNNATSKLSNYQPSYSTRASVSMPSAIASNSRLDASWLNLIYSITLSKYSLDKASSYTDFTTHNANSQYSNKLDLSLFLSSATSDYINNSITSSPSIHRNKNYLNSTSTLLSNRYYNSNTTLSKVSQDATLSQVYANSINENLNLANQTRWLLKMSPISEKLISNNFSFTQAKQLLGSSATNSSSSSDNIWSSSNLSKIKDINILSLADNVTKIEFFEDSRSWSMKKTLFTLAPSTYSLSYSANDSQNLINEDSASSIAPAYLLDYQLMQNLLILPSKKTSLLSDEFNMKNVSLVTTDKTVYQDSFNSYLLNISTTTLTSSLPNYSYTRTKSNTFKFV